jgi:2-phosphosulfolactate phosphatase
MKIRPAIEDYLGAGAIIEKLKGTKSVEARLCMSTFGQAKSHLREFIWDCGSGRELRERGFSEDVEHCAALDCFHTVPVLIQKRFVDFSKELHASIFVNH